jgi:transcriptional regulator with XRE-family HTH domain
VPTADTPARVRAARLKIALSKLLYAELERAGLTVHAVGVAAGLSDQSVRDVFAGASLPRLDVLIAIEEVLGRPPGWIVAQFRK